MKLYHGSNDNTLTKIAQGRGRFGGVFASASEAVAESHGDYIYELSVESSRIAESCDLEGISSEELEKMFPWLSKSEFANYETLIRKMILDEEPAFGFDEADVLSAFLADDIGEADWDAQKMRGEIAAHLGFLAVEMSDEHGTSYLVLSGEFDPA